MSATITTGAVTTTTSPAFAITPAAASQLVVSTQPSASTVAGVAFAQQPVVAIEDAFGNTITSGADSTRVITASLTTGTGTLSGTLTKTAVNGVADFAGQGLKINLTGNNKVLTMSATITAGAVTTATVPAFTITSAAASQLVVTTQPSASTVAGVSFAQQPIVTIEDAFGNTVTSGADSTRVITASLTTGTGTLSGTLTKTAVAGIADFSGQGLKIDLAGNNKVLTMSATITAGAVTTTTAPAFTITFAAASQLVITTQPSASTVAGVAFAQQPVVTIEDAFGNTVTSGTNSTRVITASLTTGTGTLSGTVTKTAVAGVADFSGQGLKIDLAGNNKVLTMSATITAGAVTTTTAPAFTITPAALDHFSIKQPGGTVDLASPQLAGTLISLQITAQDQFNNTQTSFVGTVSVGATSGTLMVGSGATGVFTSGVLSPYLVAFSDTPNPTQITATDLGGSGKTGNSIAFVVNAPAAATYTWTGGGGDSNWTTAANWGGTVPPSYNTTSIVFAGTTRLSPVADTFPTWVLNSITFSGTAGAFGLSGNPLQFAGVTPSLVQSSAASQSIADAADLKVATSFSGSGSGSLTLSGPLTGSAGLTKTSTDTLILSGGGAFSGTLTDTTGTLLVNGALANAGLTTVGSGATFGGSGSVRAITVNGGGTVSPGSGGVGALSATSADFSAGGTLLLDVPTAVSFDLLNLSNTLTVGGTSILKINAGAGLAGGPITVASYAMLSGGTFALLDNPSTTTGVTATYTGAALQLTLAAPSVSIQWGAGTKDSTTTSLPGTATPANWALGTVTLGTSRSTGSGGTDGTIHFVIQNNGNVDESFTVSCTNPANWHKAAAVGSTDAFTIAESTTAPAGFLSLVGNQSIVSGEPIFGTTPMDLSFQAPTTVTTVKQQSIVITITATAP